MSSPGVSGSWSVPVLHGPSSSDNLLTTLVAWARHRGLNPRAFQLVMEGGGKTLILRGFDLPSLKDFLRYAEYSSVPALECGRPTELAGATGIPLTEVPMPGPPKEAAPEPPPAPVHPATLSSSSIQMVLGTAQLLADRSTDVRQSEHWATTVLATPDLKPEQVGILLRIMDDPGLDMVRLALAESEPLRREGETLLRVPCEIIADTLAAWLGGGAPSPDAAPPAAAAEGTSDSATEDAGAKRKVRKPTDSDGAPSVPSPPTSPTIPPRPTDPETLLRAQVYARGLEARAQHWRETADRVRANQAQGQPTLQSLLEGAVFINEEEGRVAWVVPHSNSPLVKALVGYVHESHRLLREEASRRETESGSWVGASRRETYAALETARRGTAMALRLGVELRWVVLLSTDFADGKEQGFGLPMGKRPPWEEVAPAPAPTTTVTSGKITVKKKVVAPPAPGVAKFMVDPLAPLDAMLESSGVRLSLLRRSRPLASAAPRVATTPAAAAPAPATPPSVATPPA